MNLERVPDVLRPLVERFVADVDALTARLTSQLISPAVWEEEMGGLIARYHVAALVQGQGSSLLPPSVTDFLEGLIEVQLAFLAGFGAVVRSSPMVEGVIEKIKRRARLYTLAVKTA